jgi:nucleoside-diphosphate kinase
MAVARTLVLIKPDAVQRGLAGEILARFERRGLHIRDARLIQVDRDLAERHYAEHAEKPFFGELVEFITSGPVVVARLEGEGAIGVWRTMMGPTDPATAPPGTIRGDYGLIITENLVHGSDSPDSAERELKLFFG